MFKTRSISCSILLLIIALAIAVIHMGEAASRTCPHNEFYADCGADCQTLCATLNEPCLIRHIRCPDGCYCNEGFARNDSGTCVRIKDCPQKGAY